MDSALREQWIKTVQNSIQKHDDELSNVNSKIWSNPELSFQEKSAHDSICALFERLAGDGYSVKRSAYGIETAFEIEYSQGTGGRTVVFNAEYDALPGIGHACGHNLIATSSITAFIAACEAIRQNDGGLPGYTIRLLGTPAEEGGGGKILLLNAGAYKDVDACLMVHPGPLNPMDPEIHSVAAPPQGSFIAISRVDITYKGMAAHAGAAPWRGINALDAAVAAYVNVSVLRQQIPPTSRVHGIITNGGDRPNIIPHESKLQFYIRALDFNALQKLIPRVKACFDAAAASTGCTVEYEWDDTHADLQSNMPICETYTSAMKDMGYKVMLGGGQIPQEIGGGASTDMGNVTYAIPGFHGLFSIPGPAGVWPHTPEFKNIAGSPAGYKRALECGAGMAVTACHILVDDDLVAKVKEDFKKIPALK